MEMMLWRRKLWQGMREQSLGKKNYLENKDNCCVLRTNLIQVPWNQRKGRHKQSKSKDDIRKAKKESEFDQKSWQLRDQDDGLF